MCVEGGRGEIVCVCVCVSVRQCMRIVYIKVTTKCVYYGRKSKTTPTPHPPLPNQSTSVVVQWLAVQEEEDGVP